MRESKSEGEQESSNESAIKGGKMAGDQESKELRQLESGRAIAYESKSKEEQESGRASE